MKKLLLTPLIFMSMFSHSVFSAGEWNFCTFREVVAGENITTTASSLAWDTSVDTSSSCALQPNNIDTRVLDPGHYLVSYTAPTLSTGGSDRSEIQTWLQLNATTNLPYGRGQGYIRRSDGNTEAYNHSSAILELNTDDEIRLMIRRTDNNSATVARRSDASGIQFLKLDDAWDYIRSRPAADQLIPNDNTFRTLTLDIDDEADAGSFSRTGGDITLSQWGKYLVTYNIGTKISNNNRSNIASRLTLDGSEIAHTRVTTYMRGSNNTRDGMLTWTGIIDVGSGGVLRIQARKSSTGSSSSISTKGNESGISIAKIPNNSEYLRISQSIGGQDLSDTQASIDFNTTLEENQNSFDHNPSINSSRILLQRDGDYLLFHSLYASNTSGNTRETLYHQWRTNNINTLPFGSSGQYLRSNDSLHSGSSGSILLSNLSSSDYLEITQTNESTNSSSTYSGGFMGVQGVRVCTLFNTHTINHLTLSNTSIIENNASPAIIGSFSHNDTDVLDTYDYTLVPGLGDTDNSLFSIIGNTLQINVSTDYEVKDTYSIRAQIQDCNGVYEEVFLINVENISAPGGTENNLLLWLKSDTGTTGVGSVTSWQDQSSNNFTATATNGPEKINSEINFHPTLQFSGVNEEMIITNGILGNTLHTQNAAYIISQVNTVKNSNIFWENPTGSERLGVHVPWWDQAVYYDFGTCCWASRINTPWGGITGQDYIWGFHSSTNVNTPSGTRKSIYRDGKSIITNNNNASLTGNNTNFYLGSTGGSNFYNGNISEVIIHDRVPDAVEHNKIQTYLAIKYGLTLDQSTPTNYTLSNGNIAWSSLGVGSTYVHNITGIAQDDESTLDQTKSRSENSNPLLTIEESGNNMEDGESLMWSHNNDTTTTWSNTESPSPYERISREWRIEENNGDVGDVTISINTSEIPILSWIPHILIDSDGDFSTGTTALPMTELSGVWFVTTNLADDSFITIAQFMGTMDVTIVNNLDVPVVNPQIIFTPVTSSFVDQISTGVLGTSTEKIQINNQTGATSWSVTIAPLSGETQWDDGGINTLAYDDDVNGIQLEVQASWANISGVGGSSLSGTNLGTDAHFSSSISSVTLMTCSGCDPFVTFNMTNVLLEQDIPATTPSASYEIDLEITIL